jgi:hypothetical protein
LAMKRLSQPSTRSLVSIAILMALVGPVLACAESSLAPVSAFSAVEIQAYAEALPASPARLLAAVEIASDPGPQAAKPGSSGTACQAELQRKRNMTPEELKAEESQYIAGFVPNFNTVIGGCAAPLTASGKWSLVSSNSFNPFTFGLAFFVGGIDEVDGAHNGYGWGPGGYFKRAGSEYANTLSGNVFSGGVFPVLLHQDPRYFQLGAGHPLVRRVVHAVLGNFICKGDDGLNQLNTSNILGNVVSGALSNLYYPRNERGFALTFESALTVTVEGALAVQLLEFSPELSDLANRILHPRRSRANRPLGPPVQSS